MLEFLHRTLEHFRRDGKRWLIPTMGVMSFVFAVYDTVGLFRAFTEVVSVQVDFDDDSCYNITNHENFYNESCCHNATNECGDYEFCFGVALALWDPKGCCDAYESCKRTRDVLHTVGVIEFLNFLDVCVSSMVLLYTLQKSLFLSKWFRWGDVGYKMRWATRYSKYIIISEIFELILASALIAYVNCHGISDFAEDVLSNDCYNAVSGEEILFALRESESVVAVAVAEIFVGVIAIVSHCLEINNNEDETPRKRDMIVGSLLDIAEFGFAVYNYFLIGGAINGVKELFRFPTPSSGACISECCVSKLFIDN